MPNETNALLNRRGFIATITGASAGLMLAQQSFANPWFTNFSARPKFKGVQLGVITYSFRSMPGNALQLLQYCKDASVDAIELIGDAAEEYAGKPASPVAMGYGQSLTDEQKKPLEMYKAQVAEWRARVSMDKFIELRKLYNRAGVHIYAFKPRTCLEPTNTDAEIEYAMRAAKALGAKAVTVELPTQTEHAKRLGNFGTKHSVFIGYHAHTQATDTAWDEVLAQSPYNSMNLDCGHYIAAGGNNTRENLLALIERKADRITSLHLKDRKTKGNGGANMPWGEGDTPIKEILALLRRNQYTFPATVELEYEIPPGSDAVKEVAKCLTFAQNALK
jgi:sugar phosphate isomerase/epimerase